MEFEEFYDLMKKGINKVGGFPQDGVSYLELNNGQEMIFHDFALDRLDPAALGMFIIGLAKFCRKAYIMSPTYTESLISPNIDKSGGHNKYFSIYEIDLSMVSEEPIHEQVELSDYNKIKVTEHVYTFNKKTCVITSAPVLTEIHTDVLKCTIEKEMLFAKRWKKYMTKVEKDEVEGFTSNKPFGENKTKDDLTPKEIVSNHFINYFKQLYKLMRQQMDLYKDHIENDKDFGTYNIEQLKIDINNKELDDNEQKDDKQDERSSNETKRSSGSLKDRIRERLKGRG